MYIGLGYGGYHKSGYKNKIITKDVTGTMKNGIRYIIRRIEQNYYIQNPNLLIDGTCCMKVEKLPCNCITGIMVNYAGYIVKNCMYKEGSEAKYTIENNIAYLKVLCDGIEISPIMKGYEKTKRYHFQQEICEKNIGDDQQVYIGFGRYRSINEITELVEDYEKENINKLELKERYYVEFWIRLLSVLRVKKLEESSKAFLSMAIFMFPGKTLGLIKNEISLHRDLLWKKQLVDFLCEYLDFLKKIGNPEQGFFFKFSRAFENLTQVRVGEFIESELREGYEIMIEVLQSACAFNADEVHRSRSGFRAILREIRKSWGDLEEGVLNKFSGKINDVDNMYASFNLGTDLKI